MKYIADVVAALNSALDGTALSDFYRKRSDLNGGRGRKGGVLQVTRDGDKPLSGYSFHWGGRSELQFNVGFEDERYFRFGVAFSLKRGQNLPDPVSVLYPKITRFNDVLAEFPELRGLRMWCWQDGVRSADAPVGPIPAQWVRPGNFVFVGERVDAADGVSQAAVERAARRMASLWPLYERIEAEAAEPSPYKVARLCWNTDYWQRPTGWTGKTRNSRAFEAEHGFGHEEWLFDHSRLIDGWKYGFVQALNRSHATYAGQRLNLLLYTIDDKTKARYWVATLRDVEVLTEQQARQARVRFEKNGWVREMWNQVEALGLDGGTLDVDRAPELVNLRYRPENWTLFDPPIPFPADELPAYYYGTLQDVPKSQVGMTLGAPAVEALSERNINTLKTTRNGYVVSREIDLRHKQWQKELREKLPAQLPGARVHVEMPMFGHLIDAVVERGGKRVFIELKTQTVVKQVIREALAQLMEYSYWPPTEHRADALLIVGPGSASQQDMDYLALLRERFSLPVHYRQYREGSIVGISELMDAVSA